MEFPAEHRPRRRVGAIFAAIVAAAALTLTGGPAAHAATGCDKVASPSGSDSAEGTVDSPYRTVQQLSGSLGTGQVGCLRQGSYGGSSVFMKTPGVTLQSYPGERATITAFLEIYPEGARSRLQHLRFDGRSNGNRAAVKLNGDDVVFAHNEVTKGGDGICVLAGSSHPARHVVIERNRIFDCGPSSTKLDHQLYLAHTRGAVVRQNILHSNSGGWGVHMYPDADGTLVERNVIDGNKGGVIFAGDGSETSDDNEVRNNAVTFSGPRWNIEGSWSGGPRGTGNRAHHNCVYSTGDDSPAGINLDGFAALANSALSESPYVNRGGGDYRFRSDSPCASLVGNVAGPAVDMPARPRGKASRLRALLTLRSRRSRVRAARSVRVGGKAVGVPAGVRVALQVRRQGAWRTIGRRKLRSNRRFSASLRTSRVRRHRVVRLRAVVPGVATSRTVRLRVVP